MTLHQLFLADLGPDLELTPETLRQAGFAVRRNDAQSFSLRPPFTTNPSTGA